MAELVAAADPDTAGREYMHRAAPGVRTYADAEALLGVERPDVVIVATPPHTHHDLCLLALKAGAHVLCEKPFVGSPAEADEVIAAARAGPRVAVNHQYRYLPFYEQAARRLRQGEFGRLYFVQAQQRMFLTPEQEAGWRGELRKRVLFEFGMHVLDLLSVFFESDAIAVAAQMPQVIPGDATDVLVVLQLTFPGPTHRQRRAEPRQPRCPALPGCAPECERASLDIAFGGVAEASVGWSRERRRPIFQAKPC